MKMLVIFVVVLFWNLSFPPTLSAMEPDEESLRDPKFVAEYGCSTEHFLIKEHFEKEEWHQAMKLISNLERKGYSDRFLTTSKAKIFTKMGKFNKALESFKQALGESYKCKLTIPKLNFASRPDLAREAVLWHYISQTYELMKNPDEVASTQAKAEELLTKSLGLSPEEELNNKENIKVTMIKVFSVFTLFQKPLIP